MDLKDTSNLIAALLVAFGSGGLAALFYYLRKSSATMPESRRAVRAEALRGSNLKRKLGREEEYVNLSLSGKLARLATRKENEFVPNTDVTSRSPELVTRFGLFYAVQTAINNLAKDGLYGASREELAYLRSACSSGDLSRLSKAFEVVNAKNGLSENDFGGSRMLRDLVLKVLPQGSYSGYASEDAETAKAQATHYIENRKKLYELVSSGAPVEQTSPLERIEARRKGIQQLRHDLAAASEGRRGSNLFGKGIAPEARQKMAENDIRTLSAAGMAFLGFDYDRKELSLLLDFRKLFDKKYDNVVSYARNEARKNGTIAKITTYLHYEQGI